MLLHFCQHYLFQTKNESKEGGMFTHQRTGQKYGNRRKTGGKRSAGVLGEQKHK